MPNKTNWRGTLQERLNKNTVIDSKSGCHNWIAYRDKDGYGSINTQGKFKRVHRVVWEISNGVIPKDNVICHKCDNPSCLNINHLFMGTVVDNNADKLSKGRQAKGSKIRQSKLTEIQVVSIRKIYKKGSISLKEVGSLFGVTYAMVHNIVKNKNWKNA